MTLLDFTTSAVAIRREQVFLAKLATIQSLYPQTLEKSALAPTVPPHLAPDPAAAHLGGPAESYLTIEHQATDNKGGSRVSLGVNKHGYFVSGPRDLLHGHVNHIAAHQAPPSAGINRVITSSLAKPAGHDDQPDALDLGGVHPAVRTNLGLDAAMSRGWTHSGGMTAPGGVYHPGPAPVGAATMPPRTRTPRLAAPRTGAARKPKPLTPSGVAPTAGVGTAPGVAPAAAAPTVGTPPVVADPAAVVARPRTGRAAKAPRTNAATLPPASAPGVTQESEEEELPAGEEEEAQPDLGGMPDLGGPASTGGTGAPEKVPTLEPSLGDPGLHLDTQTSANTRGAFHGSTLHHAEHGSVLDLSHLFNAAKRPSSEAGEDAPVMDFPDAPAEEEEAPTYDERNLPHDLHPLAGNTLALHQHLAGAAYTPAKADHDQALDIANTALQSGLPHHEATSHLAGNLVGTIPPWKGAPLSPETLALALHHVATSPPAAASGESSEAATTAADPTAPAGAAAAPPLAAGNAAVAPPASSGDSADATASGTSTTPPLTAGSGTGTVPDPATAAGTGTSMASAGNAAEYLKDTGRIADHERELPSTQADRLPVLHRHLSISHGIASKSALDEPTADMHRAEEKRYYELYREAKYKEHTGRIADLERELATASADERKHLRAKLTNAHTEASFVAPDDQTRKSHEATADAYGEPEPGSVPDDIYTEPLGTGRPGQLAAITRAINAPTANTAGNGSPAPAAAYDPTEHGKHLLESTVGATNEDGYGDQARIPKLGLAVLQRQIEKHYPGMLVNHPEQDERLQALRENAPNHIKHLGFGEAHNRLDDAQQELAAREGDAQASGKFPEHQQALQQLQNASEAHRGMYDWMLQDPVQKNALDGERGLIGGLVQGWKSADTQNNPPEKDTQNNPPENDTQNNALDSTPVADAGKDPTAGSEVAAAGLPPGVYKHNSGGYLRLGHPSDEPFLPKPGEPGFKADKHTFAPETHTIGRFFSGKGKDAGTSTVRSYRHTSLQDHPDWWTPVPEAEWPEAITKHYAKQDDPKNGDPSTADSGPSVEGDARAAADQKQEVAPKEQPVVTPKEQSEVAIGADAGAQEQTPAPKVHTLDTPTKEGLERYWNNKEHGYLTTPSRYLERLPRTSSTDDTPLHQELEQLDQETAALRTRHTALKELRATLEDLPADSPARQGFVLAARHQQEHIALLRDRKRRAMRELALPSAERPSNKSVGGTLHSPKALTPEEVTRAQDLLAAREQHERVLNNDRLEPAQQEAAETALEHVHDQLESLVGGSSGLEPTAGSSPYTSLRKQMNGVQELLRKSKLQTGPLPPAAATIRQDLLGKLQEQHAKGELPQEELRGYANHLYRAVRALPPGALRTYVHTLRHEMLGGDGHPYVGGKHESTLEQ